MKKEKQVFISTKLLSTSSVHTKKAKWEYTAMYRFDKGQLRAIHYEAHDPLAEF